MRNTKVLEMLNDGQVEQLIKDLQDEIYEEALKSKPGAKKRYTAMKKYFKYHTSAREVLQKPCTVEFDDKWYTSFTNSYSLALTLEDTGEIELFDKEKGNYPDVTRLLRFDGNVRMIDFNKVIAEAKSKGYKLTRKEVEHAYRYLMLFDDSYYKIGLLDSTIGIIDDGKPLMTYKVEGKCKTLTVKNDIGYCLIMPVRYEGDPEDNGITVIRVDA
jgi:hypothetical protein